MNKSENRFYREKDDSPVMAYVAMRDGEVRTLVVDDTRDAEQCARLVEEWIKGGYTINRMSIEEAVDNMAAGRRRRAALTEASRAKRETTG